MMIYNKGKGEFKNWILAEDGYSAEAFGKCESILCQGNGYMCIRAALEEEGKAASRYTLVAGTFNLITPDDDCTRLPNSADTTRLTLEINGEAVTPDSMVDGSWERYLNIKTGLLVRSFDWRAGDGSVYTVTYERCVSLRELHVAAYKLTVKPHGAAAYKASITTGINGDDIPAEGNFINGKTFADDKLIRLEADTCESGIKFITSAACRLDTDFELTSSFDGAKTVNQQLCFTLSGKPVTFEKIVTVFTSRDRDYDYDNCLKYTSRAAARSFDDIYTESAELWQKRIWDERAPEIVSENETDMLATRFALYHLTVMSPVHDNRMNIGAKGLSGPGYNGHAFWDTEIYMLPYFIYEAPDEARSLVEYRCNSLAAAREYAKKANCEGARFPWEASWITDGETTPKWCDTGDYELHITSDIAFGAYYYYTVSGDEDFMRKSGYELILDCAKFWATRLEWIPEHNRYEIKDVIGPNEYKSHVDNNAYTNYMAHFTMELALKYCESLEQNDPELFAALDKKLELTRFKAIWQERLPLLYLPRENADGIIPEDDTFLSLVDFTNGKRISDMLDEARELGGKYGYTNSMICKQADVVSLLYLLEDLFSAETKKKNFYFYEAHCFHDSSLSLSTFSCLASDLHEDDMAYHLYGRAAMIDMGGDMTGSRDGIHAASLGGIWQCCVFGFGGVRLYGESLRIQPNLPAAWKSVSFKIMWHGMKLKITANHSGFDVENLTCDKPLSFLYNGKAVTFKGKTHIAYEG